MADVFISYSRKDKDFVRDLHEALAERGRDTWVDWEDIPLTAEWLAEIYAGIEGADAFVFVISPDSAGSKVCREELAHAVEHNKRLVPIVRRDVKAEAVPQPLGSYNWIFFREGDDFDEAFRSLLKAIDTDLDWVRAHTRLLERAIEWDKSGRDNSFALRGSDLRAAEEWQARAADKEPKLTALQTEYVLASRKAATRRQRMTLGAVTLGLIVAVALGLLALWQRNQAIDQANIALARQLAAQAELTRNQQIPSIDRSVLLGVEAMRRFPSLEADQALRGGLALLPRPVARLDHGSGVRAVAFSADGEYLATAGSDDTAQVWEVATGREVASMSHEGSVNAVAFSPDGRYLATASGDILEESKDDTARVWEVTTGREVSSIALDSNTVTIAFSPDGKYVALSEEEGTTVRVLEVSGGKEIVHLPKEDIVEALAFSPDGKYLVTGGFDRAARVWEAATGREVARIGHAKRVSAVAFSPDGRSLAVASEDTDDVRVWGISAGSEIARWPQESVFFGIDFCPGERYLAMGTEAPAAEAPAGEQKATASVVEASTGREVGRVTYRGGAVALACSDDGRYVATSYSVLQWQ